MNIIKYLLCKNSGMSNEESFLRASTNMPISGGAVRVIEKTVPFADIISITDALARPAVDLQSEITATQNLNGYEYPWVGGAGKNLCSNDGSLHIGAPNSPFTSGVFTTLPNYCDTYYLPTATSANLAVSCDSSKINDRLIRVAYCNDIPMAGGAEYRVANLRPNTSIAVDTSYTYIVFIFLWNNVADKSLIQIEKGTTCTQFAPYENICPISGRTEVNVTRTGKNILYKKDTEHVLGYTNPQMSFMNGTGTTLLFYGVAGKTYTYNRPSTANRNILAYFGTSEPTVGSSSVSWANVDTTFTVQSSGYYVLYIANTALDDDIQIELGSTATEYEPYEGDTFNTELGRTVYGGTLDLTTGELTVTHEYARIGDLTIDPYTWGMQNEHTVVFAISQSTWGYDYKFKCDSYAVTKKDKNNLENGEMTGEAARLYFRNDNFTTKQEFQTALADVNIVFKLLLKQKYTLTPTEVQMLLGNNTIWADSGRVQLTYYAPEE